MYYPVYVKSWFATFPDGRAEEITDNKGDLIDINISGPLISQSQSVVEAIVKKMHVCTFLGDLELEHCPTSYPHDEFPYIPFVGYVDRYKQPFGVPGNCAGRMTK